MSSTSSERLPRCRHFGVCGGCETLDLPYPEQLARKGASLRALFAPLAGELVSAFEVQPSPQITRYRNKAIYPVRHGGSRGVIAGFYRRGTHELVDVRECALQEPCLTQALGALRDSLAELALAPYDERDGSGFVRALYGRVATGTGELQLGVVTRGGEFPRAAELARRAQRAAEGLATERGKSVRLAGFARSIHDEPGNRLLGERCVPLLGRAMLRERLGRLDLEISMGSFYQVNAPATIELYRLVEQALGDEPLGRVVEAYAGIGSLALWIAPRVRELWAIEVARSAVRDARRNFSAAGLDPARILEGRVEERLAEIEGPIDALVVDPPRAGLSPEVLRSALDRAPARLIYVSCNPQTLHRDAVALIAGGYRLVRFEAVDLFPHTTHVEVLATFVRESASS
ncbi:MAG: 23S rRNA (uracil(1939)-C(5))-methyltransferase RlmD [Planctomycetes bacterium]|nr:23S rRNA (uracil(1939)-C(5))-methyltransferase RlmD [Planctomycetota bacterium]